MGRSSWQQTSLQFCSCRIFKMTALGVNNKSTIEFRNLFNVLCVVEAGPSKANTTARLQSQQAGQGGSGQSKIISRPLKCRHCIDFVRAGLWGHVGGHNTKARHTNTIIFSCICHRAFISYIEGRREKTRPASKKTQSLLSLLFFFAFTDFYLLVGLTSPPWWHALHPLQNMNSVGA